MSAAAILALGAAFCFALAQILIQFGLRYMPAWRSPLYSIGGSAVAACVAAPIFVDWTAFDPRAAAIFAVIGCFFPVAVSILSVRSNAALGPAVAGAVGNVTPVFAVLGAVLLLGERLALLQLAGLAAVVGGVVLLALRGGTAKRQWSIWMLGLPLAAAFVRGIVQPAIKTGLGLWPDPVAATTIGYTLSTLVILAMVGRRAVREGPADRRGVAWFLAVGATNGMATFLLYAALGLGSISLVAPLVAIFPLLALGMSLFFLHGERLAAIGVLGIFTSVAGVILLLVGGS